MCMSSYNESYSRKTTRKVNAIVDASTTMASVFTMQCIHLEILTR